MEPVSATLAAIAAVKGAVETATNIKDIGQSLEALFSDSEKAEKEPKKKKGKTKPKTRMQQVLRVLGLVFPFFFLGSFSAISFLR